MPECKKFKRGGLDQYGAEGFGRLIFAMIRKNVGTKGLMLFVDFFRKRQIWVSEPRFKGDARP